MIDCIATKDFWFEKLQADENNHLIKRELKYWQNKITSMKRQKRRNHFGRKFEEANGDVKKTWNCIKEVLHNGRPKKNDIAIFSTNDPDPLKIEKNNELNNYFATIGGKIIREIEQIPSFSTPHSQCTQFQQKNTDATEVQRILQSIKNSKSQGFDEVDAITLKRKCTLLAPKSLKTCRIKPVFKNGDKSDPANYRPINILPIVDKIMSKIVNEQLMSHLKSNNIINPHHYRFRRTSNTQSALFDLTTAIQSARDQGKIVIVIFNDIKKAFDTVYREILLQELNAIGITGRAHLWFQDYLRNRIQYIQVGDYKSTMETVDTGIPQGNNLASTLFLIHINNLANMEAIPYQYADDTALQNAHESKIHLQNAANRDMNLLHNWMNKMKLSLNVKKNKQIYDLLQ